MNLSNKLTFHIVFAVLFAVGIIFAPTVMAAEGGPTIVNIELDDSQTVGDADGPLDDDVDPVPAMDTVSNGNALLTTPATLGGTNVDRAILVDVATDSVNGTFRLMVTFSEDVYSEATARPDAPTSDPSVDLHDQSDTRTIAVDDLAGGDITILSAIGITTGTDGTNGVTVTNVERVLKNDPTPDAPTSGDEVYEPRKFYVTIQVTSAVYSANLPLNIALVVDADAVYGIGANRVISPFKANQPGLGNEGYVETVNLTNPQQPYDQYDFQVIARPIVEFSHTPAAGPGNPIKSFEPLVITLNFNSELNAADVPSMANIDVTGGAIQEDDLTTTDVVEGIVQGSDPTMWTITIIPTGGITRGEITVKSTLGSAFELDLTYTVDNTPDPSVSFTGTPIAGGAPFTITIIYDRAPDTDLTAAGVTVTGGTKRAFAKVPGSSTAYTIVVDPVNVAPDTSARTLTVRVGDDTKDFRINPGLAPTEQSISFSGQPARDNLPYTITITYEVRPSVDLTTAGVTVTGGTKGTFARVSSTEYTIVVDPVDIAHDANPGTLTIRVGQYSRDFTNSPTGTRPPSQITFTGTPVVGGGEFTVTINYNTAPASDLTTAGVTVMGGTKGTFTKVSSTEYTVVVDPIDVPFGSSPGTVTITVVGQVPESYTIDPIGTPGFVDPEEPVVITLKKPLAGRGYLLVAHDGATADGTLTSALPSLPAGAWVTVGDGTGPKDDMPNLYKFFFSGGTISVYVKDSQADVVINEVMWARDENAVGSVDEVKHQWIELYNNSNHVVKANSITLQFTPKVAPATLSSTDYGSRRDRLSNRERVGATTGWRITSDDKGQNGSSHDTTRKPFISMYRLNNKLGDNDGVNGGNWRQTTENLISHVNHLGTPGAANSLAEVPIEVRPSPNVFTPPKSKVIINEVFNSEDNDYDWLELRFLQRTNIREWTISVVYGSNSEHLIMKFPDRDLWFNAGTLLLIVNKDPSETPLAEGQDYSLGFNSANQARGAGPHKYWNVSGGNSGSSAYLDIPHIAASPTIDRYRGGNVMLVLRERDGNDRLRSRSRFHDAVGPGAFTRRTLTEPTVEYEPHTADSRAGRPKGYIWQTNVFPINGQNLRAHNAFGSSNSNAKLQPGREIKKNKAWARNGTNHGWRKDGGGLAGNKGGLGYDRNHVGEGTPGYPNDFVKTELAQLTNAGGKVVVSEIMLTTDNGRYPQWFELHNTSGRTVDLHADTDGSLASSRQGWSIRVENHRSDSWDDRRRDKLNVEVKFRDLGPKFIPPNQTILITADRVRSSDSRYFPDSRVASIYGKPVVRSAFKMSNRRDIFLNPKGFLLEIVDGDGRVSDAVGNLDGRRPGGIFDEVILFDDPYSWNWPTDMDGNRRTSLIRKYDGRVPRPGTPDRTVADSMRGAPAPIGMQVGDGAAGAMYSWVHAVDTKFARAQITWYGSEDDYGTPGHTTSTPLPVSLSSFRPALENGEVVVRWTTESELDNAGFNVYRSDDMYGEFKQVNTDLIQGAGTTGERTAYKWVDATAKPNVTYYYQIEDVSFAGERQTLATSKLKGLISAKNKLTTTWGDLKLQD